MTIDFDLGIVDIIDQIEYIFFWLGLGDEAEFPTLDKFDHVATVNKGEVIGIFDAE